LLTASVSVAAYIAGMTVRVRCFARRLSLFIALVTLVPTTFAQDSDSRPTITRETIRRAVAPVDIGEAASLANTQRDADWRSLTRVNAGADTRVILDDGKVHRGRFQGTDERSITLEIDGVNRTLQRAQVRRVDARGGSRLSKARAWGMVGMFTGLAAGFASCRGKEGECIQGPPLTGMMIGWAAGTIVGAALPTWRSIYAVRP
jgi:hypothetical protein